MTIRKFTSADMERVAGIFFSNIEHQHDYISHGEIQMGISEDGISLLPRYREKWMQYLERHLSDKDSQVWVCEEDEKVEGFVIFGIEDDHDRPFGVIYDIVVNAARRGQGFAGRLMDHSLEILSQAGIEDCYLESGANNHGAHSFFEKHGFRHVSNIYRLAGISK